MRLPLLLDVRKRSAIECFVVHLILILSDELTVSEGFIRCAGPTDYTACWCSTIASEYEQCNRSVDYDQCCDVTKLWSTIKGNGEKGTYIADRKLRGTDSDDDLS